MVLANNWPFDNGVTLLPNTATIVIKSHSQNCILNNGSTSWHGFFSFPIWFLLRRSSSMFILVTLLNLSMSGSLQPYFTSGILYYVIKEDWPFQWIYWLDRVWYMCPTFLTIFWLLIKSTLMHSLFQAFCYYVFHSYPIFNFLF